MSLAPRLRPPPAASTPLASMRHELVRHTAVKSSSLAALEAQIRHQDRERAAASRCDCQPCHRIAELSGLCAYHQEMDRGR